MSKILIVRYETGEPLIYKGLSQRQINRLITHLSAQREREGGYSVKIEVKHG